jgi:hypothetical protein
MEKFGEKNRLLARFSPKQRAIMAASLFGFIAITMVTLLVSLVRPAEPEATPEFIPAPTTVVLASDLLRTHFTGSGLVIDNIETVPPPPDTSVSEQIVLTVEDTVGPHEVTIYMYPNIDGLVNDRLRLVELGAANKMVVYQTAVLVYPTDVESAVAGSLENVFNTIPIT